MTLSEFPFWEKNSKKKNSQKGNYWDAKQNRASGTGVPKDGDQPHLNKYVIHKALERNQGGAGEGGQGGSWMRIRFAVCSTTPLFHDYTKEKVRFSVGF